MGFLFKVVSNHYRKKGEKDSKSWSSGRTGVNLSSRQGRQLHSCTVNMRGSAMVACVRPGQDQALQHSGTEWGGVYETPCPI